MAGSPIIEIRDVTKRFPGVVALNKVTLSIERGACHALIGENGAGKSTLGRVLAGIHSPDAGTIRLNDREVRFRSPLHAARSGIGLVHQELAFCPQMTVAENLLLGDLPRRGPWLARRAMRAQARACLLRIGADIEVDAPMESLSIAQEQLVQIAAATRVGARVLVLDEPTSSLSDREAARLFALMADLKAAGVTLVYVSHRMREVFEQCDAISVLRDGRHVATRATRDTTPDEVIRHMIGRALPPRAPQNSPPPTGPVMLSVRGLSSPGKFTDVAFDLRTGEIVGLAGLVGAGRSEIAHALFGLDRRATGSVRCAGTGDRGSAVGFRVQSQTPVVVNVEAPTPNPQHPTAATRRSGIPTSPAAALARGIGYLPEDRKRQALVLSMGGRANLSLAILKRLRRCGFVRRARERGLAAEYFKRLAIRAPSMETEVSGLSGGNQQKVALAKWLAAECPILIVDEPTRGVDVGAKAEIHALLEQLAAAGAAILMISSEMPELLALSSRVLVIREGRMVADLPRIEATQERVMRLMAGMESFGGRDRSASGIPARTD